jgi:N-acetyl-anhydromuramyl-L-alanine amidase AmpD
MAKSKEYPDLQWIPPRSFTRGRAGFAVRFIVIHYTAGSERATSAEDGARYNQTRNDGTSAHYFADQNSVVQGVETEDQAHCARRRGNRLGIQYELCGTAQTREQWLDAASKATLENAARQAARDCKKYGIPVRRLSVAQTREAYTRFPNGPKGFVGHVDCTYAFPEDSGDHTDPGKEFPWDVFLRMVQAELDGDDMPDVSEIVDGLLNESLGRTGPTVAVSLQDGYNNGVAALKELAALRTAATADAARDAQAAAILAGMQTALSALASAGGTLTPDQVAALTEQVREAARAAGADAVDALTDKLESLRQHLGDDTPA